MRTLHTLERTRSVVRKERRRCSRKNPTSSGSQKVRPRKPRETTVATSAGMPRLAQVKAMTPSTTPIPMGVIETIQNKMPTA